MIFSKANPEYMSLVSMTQEKKVFKHLDPCKNNFTYRLQKDEKMKSNPQAFKRNYSIKIHKTCAALSVATHSSTLAWKIPWTEEPGGLQSTGSLRVGHNWATSLSLFTFLHWRRKWQPTPVFLLGESRGWGSLVGCHLWGCTESDTTEAT